MSLQINHNYQQLFEVLNANRTLVFPPPIMDPNIMVELLNNGRNIMNRRSFNGCRLLRYFVSLQGQDVGQIVIGLVTSHLWKNATLNEKADYKNLADQVKQIIR
ncbi:hypothetical protein C1645_873245 [Glomus cerebriforme]|uniref:Uncharacterized protein n=1 Tax=Glomus cerebriforme TaxID=658196 RepID=A0A397TEC4_9GLOM|nr:hypothetical protein C1645_873245 [Glomus cerebriforme]